MLHNCNDTIFIIAIQIIIHFQGSKPFLANQSADNWNFNVSHEGRYVVLVADPLLLCGIDVASPPQDRGTRTFEQVLKGVENSFTEVELTYIQLHGPKALQKLWSLKEVHKLTGAS